MTGPILHGKKELIISIPTNDPAELHHQLLKAISVVLKQGLINPLETPEEADAVATLAQLHTALLPTPAQLERIFTPV